MIPDRRPTLLQAEGPSTTSEALEHQRERLAVFTGLMAAIFGGLYLMGVVGSLLLAPRQFFLIHASLPKLAHLALAVTLLTLWRGLRTRACGNGMLNLIDVGITVGAATGAGAMVALAPPGLHLELAPPSILTLVLVLRAAIVPSSPRMTVGVGSLSTVPTVLATYATIAKEGTHITLGGFVAPWWMLTVNALVWCTVAILATGVVSRTIYGLQGEVREARRLGQYTLGAKIGEGGMGAVYRATHALLRRPTAVKLLLPDRAGTHNLLRFEREVQLTSALTSPYTVAVYDYGRTPDGIFYYAMEYLDGITLEELVRRSGPQPAPRVAHILHQVALALAEAHEVGLIHRDIKPANIVLCRRSGNAEVAKVVDFGLVKELDARADDPRVTNVNAITGTPLYLAPESLTSPETIDGRVDLYALGAVGYFLLTGKPVFDGKTVVEVCSHHLHTPPEPPSRRGARDLPQALEAIILRCLAKDREARPKDASALAEELAACLQANPWRASDVRAWWEAYPVATEQASAGQTLGAQPVVTRPSRPASAAPH